MDKVKKEIAIWVGLGLLGFVLAWLFVLICHFTPGSYYVITSPPGVEPLTYTPKPHENTAIEVASFLTALVFGIGSVVSFVLAGAKYLCSRK